MSANTTVEALRDALAGDLAPPSTGTGAVVVTVHRVENLHRARVLDELVRVVEHVAVQRAVRFVVHGPTSQVLSKRGLDGRLSRAGVQLVPLQTHREFVTSLRDAPFVITDGGSVQEECALLGVPTLLWRARTERDDGLGANVVLSRYERAVIDAFLAAPDRWRRPAVASHARPSAEIVDALVSA